MTPSRLRRRCRSYWKNYITREKKKDLVRLEGECEKMGLKINEDKFKIYVHINQTKSVENILNEASTKNIWTY